MINPAGMSLQQWADAVIGSINVAWPLGKIADESRWQDWAVSLVRAPGVAQRILPDPYSFTDWRSWAERAYPMLEGAR